MSQRTPSPIDSAAEPFSAPVRHGQIVLRRLTPGDTERIWVWQNDESLYETLLGSFRPVDRECVAEWLRGKTTPTEREINLALTLADGGEHIGNVYLREIDRAAGRAELHIYIGDEAQRGRGYGRQALECLLNCAFHDLGLHRVWLQVLANNQRAVRTYEQLGFAHEGRLREHAQKGGQFIDVLVMGLLAADYAARGERKTTNWDTER
jgi:RimJ/RimL family protein N-acetyltransferase